MCIRDRLLDAVQYQRVDSSSASVLHVISKQLKMTPHYQGGNGEGFRIETDLVGHGVEQSSTN